MPQQIPSFEEIRQRLEKLSRAELLALCEKCNVPFTTALKLRGGLTTDPRLATARALWSELIGSKPAPAVVVEAV